MDADIPKPANGPLTKQKADLVRKYCESVKRNVKYCPTCKPVTEKDCEKLAGRINNSAYGVRSRPGEGKGLKSRFEEQKAAEKDWFDGQWNGKCPPVTAEFDYHNTLIENEQVKLQELLKAFDREKCDKNRIKKGARELSERRTPLRNPLAGPRPGVKMTIGQALRGVRGGWGRGVE